MATTEHHSLDPLHEHRQAAARLAGLIAADDDRHFLVVFQAIMNVVDEMEGGDHDLGVERARGLLLRSAAATAPERSVGQAAVGAAPGAPEDSLYSDPTFLVNGRQMAPDGERIIGGVPTSDFPDCVAVGSNTGWCCSGTLVAPNVVVTAGHCHAECASRVLIGDDVAGEAEAQVIAVAHAELHPNYSRGKHDLCTLILAKDAEGVHPRGIAKPDALDGATSVRIAGFGNTSVYGGYGRRMMVDVPLAGNDPRFGADPAKEFVAGSPFLDRDSCNGDSGGPAYVQVDGGWQLAGATSRATDSRFRLCGDGGIYTRVRVYNDWITAVPGGHWA
jgi:secreted trypsin-like serine protease